MTLASLLVVSVMVEAVWEALKPAWPRFLSEWEEEKGVPVHEFGVLSLGVILCVGTGTDVFKIIDMPVNIPYAGNVITGIIVARGSNFVHYFFDALKHIKYKNGIPINAEKNIGKNTGSNISSNTGSNTGNAKKNRTPGEESGFEEI